MNYKHDQQTWAQNRRAMASRPQPNLNPSWLVVAYATTADAPIQKVVLDCSGRFLYAWADTYRVFGSRVEHIDGSRPTLGIQQQVLIAVAWVAMTNPRSTWQ